MRWNPWAFFIPISLLLAQASAETRPGDSGESAAAALAGEPSLAREVPSCTLEMTLEGTVGPGLYDYIERGFDQAREQECRSILLHINTPGGSLETTRLIVSKILSSPVPVLCLVGPPGGHAGSAGAIILMSCHVAGAEPSTNIGAATPVAGQGAQLPDDLRKKIMEDTKSWVRGLAARRGRNLEFAEKIVTEARALEASEAAKIKAIDVVAFDTARFLDFAEGKVVRMAGDETQAVRIGVRTPFAPDLRHDFLQLVMDPELAYLIFMASLALLYFEITHPGTMVPGVVGGLGLIVSLMSFHKLEVFWGAALLIALGIGLLIAEAFVASFGILGIGGVVALAAGSFLLYDPTVVPGGLPTALILTVTGTLGALMMGLAFLALRTRRLGKAKSEAALFQKSAEVVSLDPPSRRRGMVRVDGELWRFVSRNDVKVGEYVFVEAQEGLTLHIRAKDETGGGGATS